ncbi:hypothetical protein [Rhodococcus phage RGL3]|uniref:Head-to-tail connector protein n=1 Tax=Rhodococcus phage RGL3 TaxID=2922221 RepID=G9FHJ9_9CAUD|nr:hypothetical protein RoPhRGL3_gp07 [Rhodococcus phage RGL3]AEV52088.1 hypothetical protein [Rhodococcus phage RGL3]
MPEIKNVNNGGIASVSDELAVKLKATGLWTDVDEKPAPAKRAPRKAAAKPEVPATDSTEE